MKNLLIFALTLISVLTSAQFKNQDYKNFYEAYGASNYKLALEYGRKVLDSKIKSEEVYEMMIDASLKSEKYSLASDYVIEGLNIYEQNTYFGEVLLMELNKANFFNQNIEYFSKKYEKNLVLSLAYANSLFSRGELMGAKEQYKKVLLIDKWNCQVLSMLSGIYLAEAEVEESDSMKKNLLMDSKKYLELYGKITREDISKTIRQIEAKLEAVSSK